jgi:hypothetical protein
MTFKRLYGHVRFLPADHGRNPTFDIYFDTLTYDQVSALIGQDATEFTLQTGVNVLPYDYYSDVLFFPVLQISFQQFSC